MIQETVPAALAGERADRAVALITGCSRSDAVRLIEAGAVRRGDRPIRKAADRLVEGDTLSIDETALGPAARVEPDPSVSVEVVYEDDEVIVVDKPADLVVHPGAGTAGGTLAEGLLARYPEIRDVGEPERPGIVHRLDKDTTGLLMVARTESAREALADQLAARTVHRRYVAVVLGTVEADEGLIDAAIGRSKRHPTRMAVLADGRDARTRYEVERRFDEPTASTLVSCRLETGRTHQIRVHLAAIGHPVVGDDTYGGGRAALPFARPALHAAELGFTHPESGERLTFESPVPADMVGLIAGLD